MSVTFKITNSPIKDVSYECMCVGSEGNVWAECHCCGGTGLSSYPESVWPSANFASANARNLLQILGEWEEDLWGEWEGKALDGAIKGCLKAINQESKRVGAVREDYSHGRYHEHGYSDDSVTNSLKQILDICMKAKKENQKVVWG